MRLKTLSAALALAAVQPLQPVWSQPSNPVITYSYADLADLVTTSPVVASATIIDAIRIKGAQAANVPQGKLRFYVEAKVVALIRGDGGLSTTVSYVVDVPADSRGKAPKLKRAQVLLFARRVPGRATELQLTAPDAQFGWTAELEQRTRAIVKASLQPDAPPTVTRIGSAFHVAGTLPGEGETQIFIQTATNRPISLSILTRPNQPKKWGVSLGEIVDESAVAPEPDTLLWYRLACGLPRSLPDQALREGGDPETAAAAQEDYRFVLEQLGRCTRNRSRD